MGRPGDYPIANTAILIYSEDVSYYVISTADFTGLSQGLVDDPYSGEPGYVPCKFFYNGRTTEIPEKRPGEPRYYDMPVAAHTWLRPEQLDNPYLPATPTPELTYESTPTPTESPTATATLEPTSDPTPTMTVETTLEPTQVGTTITIAQVTAESTPIEEPPAEPTVEEPAVEETPEFALETTPEPPEEETPVESENEAR